LSFETHPLPLSLTDVKKRGELQKQLSWNNETLKKAETTKVSLLLHKSFLIPRQPQNPLNRFSPLCGVPPERGELKG